MPEWPYDALPIPEPGVGPYLYTTRGWEAINDSALFIGPFWAEVPITTRQAFLAIVKRMAWNALRHHGHRSYYHDSAWQAGVSWHHRD